MIKLLHLEIHDTCEECPYHSYDYNYSMSYDSGHDCDNNDAPHTRIINDSELSKLDSFPPIPDWCPLPSWKEGDKF